VPGGVVRGSCPGGERPRRERSQGSGGRGRERPRLAAREEALPPWEAPCPLLQARHSGPHNSPEIVNDVLVSCRSLSFGRPAAPGTSRSLCSTGVFFFTNCTTSMSCTSRYSSFVGPQGLLN
jgi:hypothetical protein